MLVLFTQFDWIWFDFWLQILSFPSFFDSGFWSSRLYILIHHMSGAGIIFTCDGIQILETCMFVWNVWNFTASTPSVTNGQNLRNVSNLEITTHSNFHFTVSTFERDPENCNLWNEATGPDDCPYSDRRSTFFGRTWLLFQCQSSKTKGHTEHALGHFLMDRLFLNIWRRPILWLFYLLLTSLLLLTAFSYIPDSKNWWNQHWNIVRLWNWVSIDVSYWNIHWNC